MTLAGPLVDAGAVDRDERELRGHEPGVGDDQGKGGEQSECGVDQAPKTESCIPGI